MATWEQIEKANEQTKPMTLKTKKGDKQYVEVNQRVKAFRMVYPSGTITTEIEKHEGSIVLMKATAMDENGKILGTGYAFENQKASQINNTSYIENCETSAVGRALGMCGFGIDSSIASAEEVQQAIVQQEEQNTPEMITENQIKIIDKFYGNKLTKLLEMNGLTRLMDMTKEKADELVEKIRQAKAEIKEINEDNAAMTEFRHEDWGDRK